jgi:hypothetical protein
MKLAIIAAAALLVAGSIFASAQPSKTNPPQGPETGMPSDTGQQKGNNKGKKSGPSATDKSKTNPPQGPETGMPSDTEKKGKKK